MANEGVLKVMKQSRAEASVKADTYRFRMLNDNVDKATLTILIEAYQAEVSAVCNLDTLIYEGSK